MRTCLNCNSTNTYIDKFNYVRWFRYKDGFICKKCRHKLIDNPKNDPKWNPIKNKKWNPINDPKKLRFGNKRLVLDKNPRTGVCSNCGKEGLTHIHHKQYHEDDPLKDTIELCVGCHKTEHARLKKKSLENK